MQTRILTFFLTLLFLCAWPSCGRRSAPPESCHFGIYFLDKEEQKDVWRYGYSLIDLDKLKTEPNSFVTEVDIKSFSQGKITLKKEIALPHWPISATGLYFVVVIDNKREFLGCFLPLYSSIGPDEETTQVLSERIKEIKIPQHCVRVNNYLKTLCKKEKYR